MFFNVGVKFFTKVRQHRCTGPLKNITGILTTNFVLERFISEIYIYANKVLSNEFFCKYLHLPTVLLEVSNIFIPNNLCHFQCKISQNPTSCYILLIKDKNENFPELWSSKSSDFWL